MSELDYGNARVRARKAGLLGAEDYEALVGKRPSEVLSSLSTTAYAPDVDRALARFDGLRALHEAIRGHEVREVQAVLGFFDGAAGTSLWVERYDVANLVTVLRGAARGADPDEIIAHLVPAGAIASGVLADLAMQASVREVLDRLVVWGLPSRAVAAVVARAWSAGETDAAALELALLRGWAAAVDAALTEGVGGPELEGVLRGDFDARNVLTALRLHDGSAPVAPESLARQWLPGGRLRFEGAAEAVGFAERTEVVRRLEHLPSAWRAALAEWASGADTASTANAIDIARFLATHRLFLRGDPLGIGVPVAYLSAVQVEARNLRVIGRGAAHDLPADLVRSQLVVLEAR